MWVECGDLLVIFYGHVHHLMIYGRHALGKYKHALAKKKIFYIFSMGYWRSLKRRNRVATIAGRIWLHRNTIVFGGDLIHPSHVVRSVKEAMEDFHKVAEHMSNTIEQNRVMENPKWIGMPVAAIDISTKRFECRCNFYRL